MATVALHIENWRPVPGDEGRYEVSDLGRVRNARTGRVLRAGRSSSGYLTVCLGRDRSRAVHGLVARAFLGEPPAGHEVMHLDEDRTNPRLDNLRYGTRTENILHAVRSGRWMSTKRKAHLHRPGFKGTPRHRVGARDG